MLAQPKGGTDVSPARTTEQMLPSRRAEQTLPSPNDGTDVAPARRAEQMLPSPGGRTRCQPSPKGGIDVSPARKRWVSDLTGFPAGFSRRQVLPEPRSARVVDT